jgi:hypothetical protein
MKQKLLIALFSVLLCSPLFAKGKQTVDVKCLQNIINVNGDNAKEENPIIGKWVVPLNKNVNITFNRDKTFVFNDYNVKKHSKETLTGKYLLEGKKLVLVYSDRPRQTFIFQKNHYGAYYINKKNYYFQKDDAVCQQNSANSKNLETFIIGKWFMPHSADINITFNSDKTFIFNNYNVKKNGNEILTGTYRLEGMKLILIYSNLPRQIFYFKKDSSGFYYIKKGAYHFVKSDGIESI